MKKFISMTVAAAMSLAMTAQDVQITLHPKDAKTEIPKEIYGQFSEHLGRCIYGGIWVGKDSEIPNIEGYRKDVFEAMKDLEIPVMRWPGGCFADEYHWMDGIGPQENRPRMVNTNWGGTVEDNSFGTHEFLNLCEMLNIQPYISANVGSGTVEEMAKWVEYMNSDTNSTMAQLRRKNGREKPWNVKYFGVGNESWGCGGNMRIEDYAPLYRRYATYARNYGKNVLCKVASGANGGDTHWTDYAMKNIGDQMAAISFHYYAVRDWGTEDDPVTGIPMGKKGWALNFTDQNYYEIMSQARNIESILKNHVAAMDKYDPKKKIALFADEWGTWWNTEPGTNPGWLYQQSTMRDALVASATFDIFHKYTDRLKMANIAQVVNVLQSMILTNEKNPSDHCIVTPTYHVFMMYKPHKDALFIPGEIQCQQIKVNDNEQVPEVSFTASRDKQGVTHVSISNLDLHKAHTVSVYLDGVTVKGAEGQILNSKDIHDYNDFGKGEVVRPALFKDAKVKDGKLIVNMPAHSIVTLALK